MLYYLQRTRASSPSKRSSQPECLRARYRENNHEANFRAFPLKCLAAALVVAVNSFRALQNEERGVKRVSCEVRFGENNENKYVPRALNARSLLAARRGAVRLLCRD